MKNNKLKKANSNSTLTFKPAPTKRFNSGTSLPVQSVHLYAQLDDEYTSNGMSPYTVQFLKKMSASAARSLPFNI